MASALTSPFHGLPIDEAVPAAADLTELKQASILQGRRRVRFQPQTGVSSGPGQIVQFVLADSTGLLDVNSMVLSATVKIVNPAGTYCVLDDGAAFIRRIQVLANGSLIEDIDNAHRASNLEVLSSAESDWYKHDGTFANYWKFAETLSVGGGAAAVPTSQNNVVAHATEITNQLAAAAAINGAAGNNGVQYGWPLGLLAPSLRSNKYWPLRSMGELVLQLTMANATEAIFSEAFGANTSYVISDIFLECDIIVPHPAYASLLDRMTQLESEPGLTIPIETRLVSQGQSIPASANPANLGAGGVIQAGSYYSGNLTESSIVVSRATTNLRRVMYGAQPTAAINSGNYPSTSCFPDEGCSAFQIRVGSLYFPAQPANSQARMFFMTSAAFGEPASTDKAAVFTRHNYDQTTLFADNGAAVVAGEVFYQVPSVGTTGLGGQFAGLLYPGSGVAAGQAAGAPVWRFPYADFSPKGYCFDAYKNTSAPMANDGISVLGQAGSQVVLQVRHANPEAITPTVVLDATKVIVLKDGGLRIMGA